MQGFIVVEACAQVALKAIGKAFEITGFHSLKARLPEGVRAVAFHDVNLPETEPFDRVGLQRFEP